MVYFAAVLIFFGTFIYFVLWCVFDVYDLHPFFRIKKLFDNAVGFRKTDKACMRMFKAVYSKSMSETMKYLSSEEAQKSRLIFPMSSYVAIAQHEAHEKTKKFRRRFGVDQYFYYSFPFGETWTTKK